MKFPRTIIALLLLVLTSPATGQVFVPGHAGQPLAPVVACRDTDQTSATFSSGGQSHVRRIPIVLRATNGDLLLFYELRAGAQDYQSQGIGVSRSTNNGRNWGLTKVVYVRSDYASDSKWLSLGTGVRNSTGRLLLHFANSDGARPNQVMTLYQMYSDDHGTTWSSPVEITTGLKKVNNTTPAGLPACYDKTNSPWGWCMPGPHAGIRLSSGRLVLPYNHRYSADQTLPPWAHCILSDDDGATWYLGGGFQESTGNNDGTNELGLGELTSGSIYANCRIISGGNGNKRGQATITTAQLTTTWPDYSVMTDGTNQIDSNSTQGSVLVASNGDVLVTCPNDDSIRARLTVFRSTNNGSTFPQKNVLNYGYSGYSHLFEESAGNYGCLFEATDDFAQAGSTDGMSSNQFTRQVRFDQAFITSPPAAVADWHLNDGPAGVATNTAGTELGVWSGYCPPGKGGANAQWHADGLEFLGSGAGVQLQEAQAAKLGGICDLGLSSVTFETEFKISGAPGADVTLWDNNNASTTAKGSSAVIQTSNGKIRVRMNEGTNSCTKESTSTYNDNAWHRLAAVYEKGVGLSLYFDGVKDGSTQADNLTSTTPIAGAQPFRLGSRGGGANPMPASSYMRRFRVTRGVVAPASMLAANAPKTSAAIQSGYNPRAVPGLPSTTNLKLALFCPQFGRPDGYGASDRWGGISWPQRPVRRGTYIGSYKDQSSLARMFRTYTVTAFRSPRWDVDTVFGAPHVQFSNGGTQLTIGWLARTAAATDYDFIQNTGIFTIIMAVNFVSDQFGVNQVILDNCVATGSNPGVSIYRNTSTNTVQLQVSRGGGNNRINDAYTGAITNNTWNVLAWRGQGPSAKVKHDRAAYTAGVVGAISSQLSTNNMDASDGTYASTQALTVGARADDQRGCNARIGPVLIFNTTLTDAEVAAWAGMLNKSPLLNSGGNSRLNIGVRLGFDRIQADDYSIAP